jgi:hypothetical protein
MKYLKQIFERKMLPGEMEKESALHKKISKAPFIKQYGKDRGEQIYYATVKNMAMEEGKCPCEDDEVIMEKEGKKARGSPWFIDKETRNNNPHTSRKRIPRNHPNRSKMTSSQISARKRIGNKLVASYKKRGMKLSDPSPSDPAKTVEEIIWATATKAALSGSSGLKKKNKKGSKKKQGPSKFKQKMAKKEAEKERKKKSVRDAMEKIRQQRKS